MSVESAQSLVELLKRHELLEPETLAEASQTLLPQFPEPRALANELLERDWLTAYQVNQLFQGRAAELTLGDFVLLERLGEGSMGQVFKVRDRRHGTFAALKLLHRAGRVPNQEAMRRFRREMAVVCRLDHPNIVRAVDVREVDGTLYLAMEYLEGMDLARLSRRRGPLPAAEACFYARQAAQGLQHAHENGLVHRDVKPGNLFLSTRHRAVKVLDFGLARLDDLDGGRSASTLTQAGHVMGTPDFIAPEQARNSHAADRRADLYSLGCTLYYLLAGQVPFPKGGMTEKLVQHQIDPPMPLLELRSDVPSAVLAIVERLMAKAPEDRYQTAAEVAQALTAAPSMGTLSGVIPTAVPMATPVEMPSDSDETPLMATTIAVSYAPETVPPGAIPEPRRWPLLVAAGVVLVVVALASGLAALMLFR